MFKQLALTSALALSLSGPALAFGGPAPFNLAQVTDNTGTTHIMSERADQNDVEQHANNPKPAVGNDMNTTDNRENRAGITGNTDDTPIVQHNGGDANDIDNSATVSFPWLLMFLVIAAGLAVWYFRIRKRDPLTR